MDTVVKEEVLDDQQDISEEVYDYDIVKEEYIPDERNTIQFEITEIDSDLQTKENPYKCTICNSEWKTKTLLKKHINTHSIDKNFECPDCFKTLSNKASLYKHIKSHNETSPLQCQVCSKMMKNYNSLRKHIRVQHGEIFPSKSSLDIHMKLYQDDIKPLVCEECGKTFEARNQHNYEKHVAAHLRNKNRNPECNICQRKYTNQKSLKRHMSTHDGAEKDFPCEICNKTFKLRGYLAVHQRTHSNLLNPSQESQELINCIYCSKVFNKKTGLQTHMRAHHRGLPSAIDAIPSCTVCKIVCNNMEDLKEHVVMHSAENRFECAVCGMQSKFKYLLKRHIEHVHFKIRNEKNEKDAECPICSKKCSSRNLKVHMVSHSTERPFACDVCDKTFKTKDHLKDHKGACHVAAEERQNEERCSYCTESFKTRHTLGDHMTIHHRGLPVNPEGPPFKCTVCRSTFRIFEELNEHVTIHRREFKCAICEKNFAYESLLRSHMNRSHQKQKNQERSEDAGEVIGE